MNGGKTINRFLKRFTGDSKRCFTSAILLAGGSGKRMGDVPAAKQFLKVGGVPVIERALQTFRSCGYIHEIVLVVRPEDIKLYSEIAGSFGEEKPLKIVPGGKTRQESVFTGFTSISSRAEFVCIHDGARCLVTEQIISDVCHAAYQFGAAIACAIPTDTYWTEKNGNADQSPDRRGLRIAQTPQVFRADVYRAACYTAKKNGVTGTDDASIVRACGFPVRLVPCPKENIKITTPIDIPIAEAILKERKKEAIPDENADRAGL